MGSVVNAVLMCGEAPRYMELGRTVPLAEIWGATAVATHVHPPQSERGVQLMLNRSAVAVIPKQPFLDWLNAVDDEGQLTLAAMQKTLYLVPDYEDPEDAEKVLRKVCDEIFCRELFSWHTDESVWPRNRSLLVFKQWFDVEHFDLVEDVGRVPIMNDE
jgi:hypothetical protein